MKILPFFKPFIIRNKWIFASAIISGILNSSLSLFLPLSLGRFYELVFNGNSNKGQVLNSIGLKLGESFNEFISIFLFLIVLKGVFEYIFNYLQEILGEKFIAETRLNVFHNHLHTELKVLQKRPTGKYLNRYVSDFGTIRKGLTIGIITFISDIYFSIIALVFLLNLNPILCLVLVIGIAFNILILSIIESRRKNILLEKQNTKSSYVNFIFERLHAFAAIKIFGREQIEQKRFEKKMQDFNQSNLQYVQIKSIEKAFIQFGLYLIIALVLISVFLLSKTSQDTIQVGYFIAFILLIFSLRPVLKRFLRVEIYWRNAELSISRLNENKAEIQTDSSLVLHRGYISFNNVSFGYENKMMVLKNLSFEAKRGEICRIIGQSGVGKSTIFRLLTKMHQPLKGEIYIDGQNIRTTSFLGKYISYFSDDIPLLGKDIYEAIVDSKNELNRRRALNILNKLTEIFGVTGKIYLEKKIQNGGANLSFIEKKVLILARTFVIDKPIILLDEPFAGLDTITSDYLGSFINEMKKNKTILLISSQINPNLEVDSEVYLNRKLTENLRVLAS
jgi:ABC-type multidrug transport system fused ATPase/permease subunit